jgi:hypothetical protein
MLRREGLTEERMRTVASALIALIIMVGVFPAWGAEIKSDIHGDTVLEGKIESGDFNKLQSFLFPNHSFPNSSPQIYLASPGGDLTEAMKIGRLVRSLKLETRIPGKYEPDFMASPGFPRRYNLSDVKTNYMCVSACFFVFVAGVKRFVDSPSGDAILGVHRPYLSESDLQALSSDQAITSANRTRAVVEIYLRDMGVPLKYLDEMFSVSKDSVYWISRDEIRADFSGFIPELRDWVDARCDNRSQAERIAWDKPYNERTPAERAMIGKILEKVPERGDCEDKLQRTLSFDAFKQALVKSWTAAPPNAQ